MLRKVIVMMLVVAMAVPLVGCEKEEKFSVEKEQRISELKMEVQIISEHIYLSDADKSAMQAIVEEYEAKINESTTLQEIESVYNEAREKVRFLDTQKEYIAKIKQETQEMYDKGYYSNEDKAIIDVIVNEYETKINESTTLQEIADFYNEVSNKLIFEDGKKQYAERLKSDMETLQDINYYTEEDIQKMTNIVSHYAKNITESKTIEERDDLYGDAMMELLNITPQEVEGEFYSLQQAYDNGLLTVSDLEKIKEIHSKVSHNKMYLELSRKTEKAIKNTELKRILELTNNKSEKEYPNATIEGILLWCYGEYNGMYIVKMHGYFMYPDVQMEETIGGVTFYYSPPMIKIWKIL